MIAVEGPVIEAEPEQLPEVAQPISSVLPVIKGIEGQTTKPNLVVTLDQSPGDRHEIGLFTEWGSECIATGVNCDLVVAQADAILDLPWCDRVTMQKRYYAGGEYSLSYEHTPNVFFLPYILTGDKKYIAPMECQYQTYSEWRFFKPEGAMNWLYGRDMAWQLRNLAELAYAQKQGDTAKNIYVGALEATRQKIATDMENPEFNDWHVLGWKYTRDDSCTDGYSVGCYWNGWFENFLGQVTNHIVQLGFTEWMPIVTWHFEHLKARCGGTWDMKNCANDYVFIERKDTWETASPWKDNRVVTMALYPADKMTPTYFNGQWISYPDRIESARGWAAMAAQNGVQGARELEQQIAPLIDEISSKKYFKFNFK